MGSLPPGIEGECSPRFRPVVDLLARHLDEGRHHGAALAVRFRGEPAVDVWGGRRFRDGREEPWRSDTLAVSFSTTKAVTTTAVHMAVERAGLDYDMPVVELWPEFAPRRGPKQATTIRHCLAHEAGVPQIRGEVADVADLADWEAMVAMMERLQPLWEPGTANGYHALNFGWLAGELVRRIDGRPLPQFVAEEIGGPLDLDGMFIGTPPDQHHRVAPVHGADYDPALLAAVLPPEHLLWRALTPDGDMMAFLNSAAGLETVGPAFTGCFTARSLATLMAALGRGGWLGRVKLVGPETMATATTVQNTRPDLVLMVPMHWRLGYMGGGSFLSPAGPNQAAFGHSGFGGSLAVADPGSEVALAVTLDRLEIDLLAGDRTRGLVLAAVEAAGI